MFGGLFGPKDKRTPQEKFDDLKKEIRANSRTVERQIRNMERERTKLQTEIKKLAKSGASPAVLKIKCKTFIQMQKAVERLHTIKANVESTLTQVTLQKAQILQASALKSGTVSMKSLNENMSPAEMAHISADFAREMEKNGLVTGMMNDTLDGMDADVEAEADEEVEKVLMDVAGIKLADLKDAGTSRVSAAEAAASRATLELPSVPTY